LIAFIEVYTLSAKKHIKHIKQITWTKEWTGLESAKIKRLFSLPNAKNIKRIKHGLHYPTLASVSVFLLGLAPSYIYAGFTETDEGSCFIVRNSSEFRIRSQAKTCNFCVFLHLSSTVNQQS